MGPSWPSAFWLSVAGRAPGIGVAGGQDPPPGSDESHPAPGLETDIGATAAVPGATAGATAGPPGTGVRNTSNYSDSFSSCSRSEPFLCVPRVCRGSVFGARWPFPVGMGLWLFCTGAWLGVCGPEWWSLEGL